MDSGKKVENIRKSLCVMELLLQQLYDEYFTISAVIDSNTETNQVNKELE